MEARQVLLLQFLGLLLIGFIGSSQGTSIKKRSSEQARALHLKTELQRVKRFDEDPGLSRVKREDLNDEVELSRMKRNDMDEEASLSRQKRQDLDDLGLSRVKRHDLDEAPGLSRQKRRDLEEDGLSRVKRDDLSEVGLSRQKRKDLDEVQLSRVKRGEEGLMRVKRVDADLPELSRVKRGKVVSFRKKRNAGAAKDIKKKNADMTDASKDDSPEKKDTVELSVAKSGPTTLEKKSLNKMATKTKRKRGYWEKRTRGEYLLHRANKRGNFHKRRYMNKRGRARFMKRKSYLAKQKLHREANKKMTEKEFVKKSLAKNKKSH